MSLGGVADAWNIERRAYKCERGSGHRPYKSHIDAGRGLACEHKLGAMERECRRSTAKSLHPKQAEAAPPMRSRIQKTTLRRPAGYRIARQNAFSPHRPGTSFEIQLRDRASVALPRAMRMVGNCLCEPLID